MIRRLLSALLILWAIGFTWFAIALPRPAGADKADAVVVLTGGSGRIVRGLEVLDRGLAPRLFVSGVDRHVKPGEFAAEYKVAAERMQCCVTLGFESTDTFSNAQEVARWVAKEKIRKLRLVTNDWHMRRAAFELQRAAPEGLVIIEDGVPSRPSLRTLFVEYHKLLARRIAPSWSRAA